MADQSLQLERMAALERSSQEQSEKVKLLEARVETLEQDNFALKEKASKPQEKVKAAGFQAAGEGQGCCQGEERYSFPFFEFFE
jgi:hypothetical protein